VTFPSAERLQLTVFIAIGVALVVVTVLIPALGVFDVPEVPQQPRLEVEVNGEVAEVEQRYVERPGDVALSAGDEIIVGTAPGPAGDQYFIIDYVRRPALLILGAAFMAMAVLIGRWRGLTALLGLAATLLIIVRFIIPGILSGANPVLITISGALVIVLVTLYLAHGVSTKTTVALVGTALSFGLTAILAYVSIEIAKLSGLADEQSTSLLMVSGVEIDFRGLLLSGMIIGALGVLDDVTTTQASSVFELRDADPLMRSRELYRRGMNIGRDHIAATVNTLVLAYAGASLPVLIILAVATDPLNLVLNREFLATEIVRTLVGSMGLIAAVPITTALAALAADRIARSQAMVGEEA
jgi:uncharacterized membrane protein